MAYTLDYKYESLNYTARFEKPVLELWGAGADITRGMYQAYLPFGVPLANFQIGSSTANAAEPVVTVKLGDVGTTRFAFDRTESSFANFSEEAFRTFPALLAASTDWLRDKIPSFKIASHSILYSSHNSLNGGSAEKFLESLNPRSFKDAGKSTGHGAIYNHVRSDVGWITQLMIDRSQSVKDGLFISLGIVVNSDKIDYDVLFGEGRQYLDSLLAEVNLRLPDIST